MQQQTAKTTKTMIPAHGTKQQSIRRTLATSLKGQPLLGYCIYWSFSETKTTHTEFTDTLKAIGMPVDIAPETRAKSAVTKALEHFVGLSKGSKLRDKVVDDADKAAWVVVQRNVDSIAQDVSYETQIKVTFDKKAMAKAAKVNQAVRIDGGMPEVQDQLRALIADYATAYTTDQIRSSILNFVHKHCEGLTVRENGGLYFIPAMHEAGYTQLKSLFEKLNAKAPCSVDVIPILDDAEAAASMWKALVGEATSQMAEMRKDIEALSPDKNPSARSIDIKMKQFHDLKTKIQMYEVLLNGTAKDLVSELAGIEASFQEKLIG